MKLLEIARPVRQCAGMHWLVIFYFGLAGWLMATGQLGVWAAGWIKSGFGALLLVPGVLLVMLTADAWMRPIGQVVEDLEQLAERKTGRKDGWAFKLLMAALCVWVLPWLLVIGGSIAGGR